MTMVAGLVFGDLRDFQDPNWTSLPQQIARSGYAGEARGHIYSIEPSIAALQKSMDDIIGITSSAPYFVNLSGGFTADDPQCLGESVLSRSANDLYEDGILLVSLAGNSGHGSTSDCRIWSPSSAIGAFVVGAHHTGTSGESNVRTDSIATYSSRGGTSSEGKRRAIVDITGFGYRENLFATNGGYSNTDMGTSYSTPTMTAAAINFLDQIRSTYGTILDGNPGGLHVNLLLLGDRFSDTGKLFAGYDNLYGAGRLKARRADNSGMDAPWAWYTGAVCVGHQESVDVVINGGAPLPSAVDVFKGAIWWYDRRHENGTAIDDIDLYLKRPNGAIVASSTGLDEERERVFSTGVAGNAVKLEIRGYSVTADDEGCGSNKMKVYYAYFYEDSARDDGDGPGTEIEVE